MFCYNHWMDSLATEIRSALKDAMMKRDERSVNVYRGLLASFTNELIAKGKKPTDLLLPEEELFVLRRAVKQRRDSIEQFQNGGRADLASQEIEELSILEKYLPQGKSEEEIKEVVRAKISELGTVDRAKIGQLMGAVMKALGAGADGAMVKKIIEKVLNSDSI